jgi:hypothetical protein
MICTIVSLLVLSVPPAMDEQVSTAQERLQTLFEKISDNYNGLVELLSISPECAELQFLTKNGSAEAGRVRIFPVAACLVNKLPTEFFDLVKVADHYGGPEIYVSSIPSAIIAVACR